MEEEEECLIPQVPERRWYLVAMAGTSLSVISLISNVLIARVLLQRSHRHFFFLGLLALSDTFLSFCYGPVVAMEVARYRLDPLLVRLWWSYVGPLLALCHVSMTFSCCCIILATVERYLITVKSAVLSCFRDSRSLLAILMLFLALILRGTAFFEIEVTKNKNCTGVIEYEPTLTSLVDNWLYGTIFRFYLRTICTVFIPFGLLSYLNYKIVTILRRQQRSAAMFRFGTNDHKMKIRSATRLLVLIVSSYLVANSLNVFITAWEYVDINSTSDYYEIYETMTDVISMLYVFTCATRLLVYIVCNEEIRFALYDYLCGRRKSALTAHDYKPIQKLNYDGSQRKSATLGTDFDRIAIAMVLAQTAREHSAEELQEIEKPNDSFVIANQMATEPPSSPNGAVEPNSAYNLMVKVVPY